MIEQRRSGIERHDAVALGHLVDRLQMPPQVPDETAGQLLAPTFTFEQYVNDVFFQAMRNKWKDSTRSRSETDIAGYLFPTFGERFRTRLAQSITSVSSNRRRRRIRPVYRADVGASTSICSRCRPAPIRLQCLRRKSGREARLSGTSIR